MRKLDIDETFEVMNPILCAIFEREHPYIMLNEDEQGFSDGYIFSGYRVESVSDNFVIAYDRHTEQFNLYIRHHSKGWFIGIHDYKQKPVYDFLEELVNHSGVNRTEKIEELFKKVVAY